MRRPGPRVVTPATATATGYRPGGSALVGGGTTTVSSCTTTGYRRAASTAGVA